LAATRGILPRLHARRGERVQAKIEELTAVMAPWDGASSLRRAGLHLAVSPSFRRGGCMFTVLAMAGEASL